jgi:tRNA threonylcarbamoyladenosine biosynthesis protein TsaB
MISLFLDTSCHMMTIAIYKGKRQLYFFEEENKNDLSIKLIPKVKEIMEALQLYVTDIEKVFVVNGPGSFTGLRIGLSFAKTLAWALNIPIVPISELEFLATTDGTPYIVPMIDARRDAIYAALYTADLKPIIEDVYIKREEFLEKVKEYREHITFVSLDDFPSLPVVRPKVNVTKIIEKYIDRVGVDVHTLIPNYLKKTEAEEKLNGTSV